MSILHSHFCIYTNIASVYTYITSKLPYGIIEGWQPFKMAKSRWLKRFAINHGVANSDTFVPRLCTSVPIFSI